MKKITVGVRFPSESLASESTICAVAGLQNQAGASRRDFLLNYPVKAQGARFGSDVYLAYRALYNRSLSILKKMDWWTRGHEPPV